MDPKSHQANHENEVFDDTSPFEANHNLEKPPSSQDDKQEHLEHAGDGDARADFCFTTSKALAISGLAVAFLADAFALVLSSQMAARINQIYGPNRFYILTGSIIPIVATPAAPVVGYISDIFGRRRFLLAGVLLAAIGNVTTANVNGIDQIFGTEIITCIGILFKQVVIASLAEIVPRSSRPFAFGCLWASSAPAQAFGPIIAASITLHQSWRVAFWIPFALNLLALVLIFFWYHPLDQHVKEKGKTRWQQLLSLDWIGCSLIAFGAQLALVGAAFGLFIYPWGNAKTLGPLVVGIVMIVSIIPFEYFMRLRLPYPMYPRSIFRQFRRYTLFLAPSLLCALVASSTSVIWPQQVQLLYTKDTLKAGWFASAPQITGVFLAPIYGRVLQRLGRYSNWLMMGLCVLLTLFAALQAIVSEGSLAASTVLACLVNASYSGLLVGFTSVFQFVPHHYLGTSVMTHFFLRAIGNFAGSLVYSLVLTNKLKDYVVSEVAIPLAHLGVDPSLIPVVLEALTTGAATNPVLSKLSPQALQIAILGVKTAFIKSFKIVYYSTLSFGLVSTILIAFTTDSGPQLQPIVDIRIVEGGHFNVKYDTGKGTIIDDRPWVS
ncbi:trichothecene efflux pump [Fonsecaea pedrosoi]|nr:trichothecene efflux pump [Fonsecaea pedrosoi]